MLTALALLAAPANATEYDRMDLHHIQAKTTQTAEHCGLLDQDDDKDGKNAADDADCWCEEAGKQGVVCQPVAIAERCETSAYGCEGWDKAPAFGGTYGGQTDIVPIWGFGFMELADGAFVGSGGNLQPGMIVIDHDPERVMQAVETGEGEVAMAFLFQEGFAPEGVQLEIRDEGAHGLRAIFHEPIEQVTKAGQAGFLNVNR